MPTKVKLEELYSIDHDNYTTGSEWVDGIIIGLATWLLIRSSEFVVLDLLTFFYGNRKNRTGYRVLRIWQLLNLCHFYKLFTGFDSDMPFTRFRKARSEGGFDRKAVSGLRVKKGRFRPLLVLSVLLAKFVVLGAEVAIIAFVIPVGTVHTSNGGLSLTWTNATVNERSLAELSTCEQLLTSNQFSETAQLVLCKRLQAIDMLKAAPQKWIPNGSLHFEQIDTTSTYMRQAGAVLLGPAWGCKDADEVTALRRVRMHSQSVTRQASLDIEPSIVFSNDLGRGEITISGASMKNEDGQFRNASAAVLPVFSDAKKTLRLSFASMFDNFDNNNNGGTKALTLNGKLMMGSTSSQANPSVRTQAMCPDVVDEIMRVTGTLHPEMIIDILISGMTVVAARNFTEPSEDTTTLRTKAGFEVGTSRKFRIPPEWMGLAAGLAMLASALTSRVNKTEASMARVYRENNNMYSACAPSFLEEELVVEGALFQNGNEYHWGLNPGKGWDQVSSIDRSEEGALV